MAEQMKSSRIDWIGDVPKSWDVEPIKYRVSFYNGDRSENYPSKNEIQSEGIPFIMGFILLRVLEFFVFRKMEMPETKNHLLCGWRQSVVQKNHLSVTIELFRHYCKKGKVILWRIRIMI